MKLIDFRWYGTPNMKARHFQMMADKRAWEAEQKTLYLTQCLAGLMVAAQPPRINEKFEVYDEPTQIINLGHRFTMENQ